MRDDIIRSAHSPHGGGMKVDTFLARRLVRIYGRVAHRVVFPRLPDLRHISHEQYEGLIAARIAYLRGLRIRQRAGQWVVVDEYGSVLATRDTVRDAVRYLRTQAPGFF